MPRAVVRPDYRAVPASGRRPLPRIPKDWIASWTEDEGELTLEWRGDGGGVIHTHPETWRRVHGENALTSKMTLAMAEAKRYPHVPIHVHVPGPRTASGARSAPPKSELQQITDSVVQLAGQVAVASTEDLFDLTQRYAALRERLDTMRRDFAEAESVFRMAHGWILSHDATRRPEQPVQSHQPDAALEEVSTLHL